MKKILYILLFFPIIAFAQENKSQKELKYHFLDSLKNEVLIKNPQDFTKKEQREIYYFVEYFVLGDSISGKVKFYYASGKLPRWTVSSKSPEYIGKYKKNSAKINFSTSKTRKGVLHSEGFVKNTISISDTLNFLPEFIKEGIWTGYHNNGKKYWEFSYINGTRDGKVSLFTNGIKRYDSQYLNDTLRGAYKYYYRDGKLLETGKYNRDKVLDFPKVFKPDGTIRLIGLDEDRARKYLDNKSNLDNYEGLYRYTNSDARVSSQYLFLIVKNGYEYNGYLVSASCTGCQNWTIGDVKFRMTEGSTPSLFDVSWFFPKDKNGYARRASKFIFIGEHEGGLIKSDEITLIKLHPKLNSGIKKNRPKNGEWAGNGSGVIISKSGYIVTNHHVIEDADDIEVEFIIDGEVKKFNAEIVQVDKTNDLAVIKIFDMNFDGLDDLPYNFKTRSSDVGTKIYAYGYPMALSLMGKEIKITDGIISSKSGFDGDITTYQITAPIQGGNSGGPLFDDKGNFIGINSSKLRADVADSVGYTIKSSYVMNLIDVLPKSIDLPSNTSLQALPLTEQIKEISKYVVLVKVK